MTSGCVLTQGPREATVAQQRVDCGSNLALMDGIDPHQYPVSRQKLRAHRVGKLLVIDGRLGMDAGGGKLLEDPVKTIVLWSGGLPGCGIAAPQDRYFVRLRVWFASVHAALLAERVARSLDARLTGCLLDPAAMLSTLATADNPLTARQGIRPAGRCSVKRPSVQSTDRDEGDDVRR